MGGVLANAAVKWPDTLGKVAILRDHPYLLPCSVAACIALLSFCFAFLGLREVRTNFRLALEYTFLIAS